MKNESNKLNEKSFQTLSENVASAILADPALAGPGILPGGKGASRVGEPQMT